MTAPKYNQGKNAHVFPDAQAAWRPIVQGLPEFREDQIETAHASYLAEKARLAKVRGYSGKLQGSPNASHKRARQTPAAIADGSGHDAGQYPYKRNGGIDAFTSETDLNRRKIRRQSDRRTANREASKVVD